MQHHRSGAGLQLLRMFCWEQKLVAEEMLASGECICLAQSITAFSLQFQYHSWVSSQNSKINRLQIKINRNTAPKLAWMIFCCHLICQETAGADPCLKMYFCSLTQSLILSFFMPLPLFWLPWFVFCKRTAKPKNRAVWCMLEVWGSGWLYCRWNGYGLFYKSQAWSQSAFKTVTSLWHCSTLC